MHYYQQDPPTGRGVAQYVSSSGKGKASGWDFPEPERPPARGGTAQARSSSRAPPQRPMPSRAVLRPRSSWQESGDVDMKDKPNEVIEVDDDDEDKRSKSVVRSPWPAGHKLIGPPGAPPKDALPPVILRVLEAAQLRIDQIQKEQMRDEEESKWTYAVAMDRSRSIQRIIKATIDTCGGFLTRRVCRP